MKFLCPSCTAKYRIGPEKLQGRQVARIRCRKCGARIHIARKAGSELFDITAIPPTASAGEGASAPNRVGTTRQPDKPTGLAASRQRGEEKGSARRDHLSKGEAVGPVPGLPGLGGKRAVAPRATPPKESQPGRGAPRELRAGGIEPRVRAVAPGLEPNRPAAGGAPVRPAQAQSAAERVPSSARASSVPPRRRAMGSQVSNKGQLSSPGASRDQGSGLGISPPDRQPVKARASQRSYPALTVAAAGATAAAVVDDLEEAVDDWFVGVNGVPLGPIPLEDLAELAAAGHVDAKSLVWRDGFSEWRPLGNFTHLARLLGDSQKSLSGGEGVEAKPDGNVPDSSSKAVVAPLGQGSSAQQPAEARVGSSSPQVDAGIAKEAGSAKGAPGFGKEPGSPPPKATETEDPFGSAPDQQSPWEDEDDAEDEQPTQIRARASIPPAAASESSPEASVSVADAPRPAAVGESIPIPNSYRPGELKPFAAGPSPGVPSARPMASAVPAFETPDSVTARKPGLWTWLAVFVVMVLVALGAYKIAGSLEEEAGPALPESDTSSSPPAAELPVRGSVDNAPSPPPEQESEEAASDQEEPSEPQNRGAEGSSAALKKAPRQAAQKRGATEEEDAEKKPAAGLLLGLDAPQTSGPTAAKSRGAGSAAGGSGLDGAAIQQTVTRNTNGLKRSCWQRALRAKAPGAPSSAKIRIALEIESTGKVVEARATAPKGFPGLGRCLESRVMQWRFPRASGPTSVEVPVMFLGQ